MIFEAMLNQNCHQITKSIHKENNVTLFKDTLHFNYVLTELIFIMIDLWTVTSLISRVKLWPQRYNCQTLP